MISNTTKQTLSMLMSTTLLVLQASVKPSYALQDQAAPTSASQSADSVPTPTPQTAEQLNALVAPIALYPDSLVAQVLGAATFPDQVAVADYWMKENKKKGKDLIKAVNKETWDPSVKALTQFPSVLDNMAGNLVWTSNLGQAFHDQQPAVMAAVQAMRAKAQAAGNLKSTAEVKVVQQTPQTIVIQPADPQVVYVPQYNPTVIYGSPYIIPLYTPPVTIAAATISFGAGIAIGAAFGGGGFIGGGFGWGFNSWGCNWGGGGGTVIYNHNTYISNNSWHGGNYNGYHPWGPGPHGSGPYGPHPYGGRGFDGGDRFHTNSFDHGDHGNSHWGGNGWGSRAESNRGWSSMRSGAERGGGMWRGGGGMGGGGMRGGGFGGGGMHGGGFGGGHRR